MQQHVAKVLESGPGITYAGAGSTLVFWGLHLSDIAAIVSTLCAVIGVGLQIYVVFRRNRRKQWHHDTEKKPLDTSG